MREFLAIDAGGTATRAVLVDEAGRRLGSGRAAGGNPTSRGAGNAAAAVASAVAQALEEHRGDPADVEVVLLAHAGARLAEYHDGIRQRLVLLGVQAPLTTAGDLMALFSSGTHETAGAALIAGTGAIGGAIRDARVVRMVDGTGWLLGDAGSGFWIGHRVARAVVDDLDGGPPTRLTETLLRTIDLDDDGDRSLVDGRPAVLGRLVLRLYDLQPVELSGLAPLAFGLAEEDDIARGIVSEAVGALATLLDRVRAAQSDGPLVFGGSVLVEGVLRLPEELQAPLRAAAGDSAPIPVADGLAGAAVLALREGGVAVDAALFARLAEDPGRAAATGHPAGGVPLP